MKFSVLLIILLIGEAVQGQGLRKSVLFLGNSYTAVNNLPQMVAQTASSAGDTLLYDSNTPGGYTLQGHSTNQTSLTKIESGNWDYVVLQEQSQLPAFPLPQVREMVFPYALALDSIINTYNECAETVFYMTWGRKNGDAENCPVWPPVCTYDGMDSLLNLRYRMMAAENNAILSPVGEVWKYIRQHFPHIELYSPDGSHPSLAGTYAAACSFYTVIFRKDPALITFNPSLTESEAELIRAAARTIIYDNLSAWHIGEYDPVADFSYTIGDAGLVSFINNSVNADSCYWDFGDGNTSRETNPIHTFETSGIFTVALTAARCGFQDSTLQNINIVFVGTQLEKTEQDSFIVYPNPAESEIRITTRIKECGVSFNIINEAGISVISGILSSEEQIIHLSALPRGTYMLRINVKAEKVRKIIKL